MNNSKHRKVHRLIQIVTCILIILASISLIQLVYAADGALLTGQTPDGSYKPGDTFKVSFVLNNNPEFAGMVLKVSYPKGLEVTKIMPVGEGPTDDDPTGLLGIMDISGGITWPEGRQSNGNLTTPIANEFFVVWGRDNNYSVTNVTLFDVTFRVTEDAVNGANTIAVSFESKQGERAPVKLVVLYEEEVIIGTTPGTVMIGDATAPPADLGNQTIGLTAPVTGAEGQTSIAGTGYTGTVKWFNVTESSVHTGGFIDGNVYMAVVTLTSETGYQWPSVCPTITVTGQTVQSTAVSGTGSGNTLSFEVVFPAVDSIRVSTQDELLDALDKGKGIIIIADIILSENIEIPDGITLTIDSGNTLTVDNGITLTVNPRAVLIVDGNLNSESGSVILIKGRIVINVSTVIKSRMIIGSRK